MPTRLIEINDSDIRLCYPERLPKMPQYMTLSHCWGGLKLFSLTRDRLESQLSSNMDSVYEGSTKHVLMDLVLHRLKYFWIDSLSIIQDDEQDWRHEASKMGSIYGCSSLHIAAASARNGIIGCFFNRSEPVLHCVRGVQVNLAEKPPQIVSQPSLSYKSLISNSPLAQRS